jgi:hypothetical protein
LSATDDQAASSPLTEAIGRLYRGTRRDPPFVLVAGEPVEFVRLVQAAGSVPSPGTSLLLAVGCPVPCVLAAGAWGLVTMAPPSGAVLVITGLLVLIAAFGPNGGVEPTPDRVRADAGAILLVVGASATLALALTGSGYLAIAAFAGVAGLAGLLRGLVLANGGLPGRIGLAMRTGSSVAALRTAPINRSLRRYLDTVMADRLPQPARLGIVSGAEPPDGWHRLEELGRRRIGWARHEVEPVLGRLVPSRWPLADAAGAEDAPPSVRAALTVDSLCDAAAFFQGVAVVLVPDADAVARAPAGRWRPGRPPYRQVLGLLQASPAIHLLIALLPTERLAERALARLVAADPDPVLRLEAIERIGFERFFKALRAAPLDDTAAGKLFRAGHGETATTVVRVEDAVHGPDGKPHVHWLPVPPHVQSAREGVAWTFGKTEREWDPLIQT